MMAEAKKVPNVPTWAISYDDIDRVNKEIEGIDLKGKNYAMVSERVTAFRKLFPQGFIKTDIVFNDGTTIIMKATVGYYREDGSECVLATDYAHEVKGKGLVNGTNHVENCSTGCTGRAIGKLGIGLNGGGICSAEELVNAIVSQQQMADDFESKKKDIEKKKLAELDKKPVKKDAPAVVETADSLPI